MFAMRWIALSVAAVSAASFGLLGMIQLLNPGHLIFLIEFPLLDRALALISSTALVVSLFYCLYIKDKSSGIEQKKKLAEANIQKQKNMFMALFNNNSLGIALVDLDGQVVKVNHGMNEILGYSESLLLKSNIYQIICPSDDGSFQQHINALLSGESSLYEAELQCHRKDGKTIWITLTISLIREQSGKPVNCIIQMADISLQKKAEDKLRHMAYHDPLTGLANRNKLEQFINHTLAQSRRHQQAFALLFLDLDRFKIINDTIGHEAGDLLLQIIAERLRSVVRNTDMVARLGGDEFVILVTDLNKTESAAVIAQKILKSIMEVIVIKGQEIYITTSIGISLYPDDGKNLATLMKNADLALYRAKEQGRNNYQFYTVEMTCKAQEKMALQNLLGHALVKDEFLLNYQPILDVSTNQIVGTEALLRWKNQEYGYITPDEIVSLAEESGLINPVSQWVLETACKQTKRWQDMGYSHLTVSVNLSARQFKQSNLANEIINVVTQTGLPLSSLVIEVTEGTVMEDPDNILRVLYQLKDIGVKIAIDDFGTGYWSLSNLRRLSMDLIKIDKTFIKQLGSDETSTSITQAIIAMVNKLGIRSVAEGVETKEQYELLSQEGCSEIQGYYLSRPLTAEVATEFLKNPIPDGEKEKADTDEVEA